KTSSGKVQRRACRQSFFDQSLDSVAQWVEPAQTSPNHQLMGDNPPRSQHTAQEIREWLLSALAQRLGIERQRIDIHAPLAQYGLDSLATVHLAGDLQQWLGYPLSPTLAYEYPSIEQLSQYLSQGASSAPVGQAHSAHASLD